MFSLLALLATLTLLADMMPQTPPPVVTADDQTSCVIVTATGEGEVKLYVNGEQVSNPYECARLVDEEQVLVVTATAQKAGYAMGEAGPFDIVVYPLPVSPDPIITIVEQDESVVITADGNGCYVELMINDVVVENPCVWPKTENEQQIAVSAFCLLDGYAPSRPVAMEYTVPALPATPSPEIVVTENEGYVTIEAVGEGEVTMYINGEIVDNPCIWYQSDEEQNLDIVATAKREGYPRSEPTVYTYCVPPLPLLPAPEIIYEVTDEAVCISVYGEGDLFLFVNDTPVDIPYMIPRGSEDLEIVVYAVATSEYAIPARTEPITIVVPALPEQAETPEITVTYTGKYTPEAMVSIISNEENPEIFYRISTYNEGIWDYWLTYDGNPIMFTEPNQYTIEAYVMVEGKRPSDVSVLSFVLTPMPFPFYDFEVDGIYYDILGNNKVGVLEHGEVPNGYQGDIVIPNQVTYSGVTYNVTEVCENAFKDCTGITSVSIGNYITKIGDQAFMGCTGLTELTLGDYVRFVGQSAFSNCTGLTKLTIGHGVMSIGSQAFAGCNSLQTIICKPATPPSMSNRSCFSCYDTATLKVYPAVLDSYQVQNYWKLFTNIVGEDAVNPIPNDVDGDGKLSVSDVTSLIDILLAD